MATSYEDASVYKAYAPKSFCWFAEWLNVPNVQSIMTLRNLFIVVAAVLLASKARAVDNGLAITPQMGCESLQISIEDQIDDI